jgi:hypothetical protein
VHTQVQFEYPQKSFGCVWCERAKKQRKDSSLAQQTPSFYLILSNIFKSHTCHEKRNVTRGIKEAPINIAHTWPNTEQPINLARRTANSRSTFDHESARCATARSFPTAKLARSGKTASRNTRTIQDRAKNGNSPPRFVTFLGRIGVR